VRFCFWLQEASFVMKETRRAMSTTKSYVKQGMSFILSHSSVFLYVILFIWASVEASSYLSTLHFDTVGDELNTLCYNNVITTNLKTLSDYAAEVAKKRVQCDQSIQLENNKTNNININLVAPIMVDGFLYEAARYYSNNTRNYVTLSVGYNKTLYDFNIVNATRVPFGKLAGYTTPTAVESYQVDPNTCSDGTESKKVNAAATQAIQQLTLYLELMFIATFTLNACAKMVLLGMRSIFWMELTTGYDFDKAFTSDQLKKKIRSKKIQGATFVTVAIVGIILTIGLIN